MFVYDLKVIIPAYNEGEVLYHTIKKLIDFFKNKYFDYYIIVVDDGSTDATPALINKLAKENTNLLLLQNQKNMGKGYSIRRGVIEGVQGRYIFFCDADLPCRIEEFNRLFFYINDYDVVIASKRAVDASCIGERMLLRRFASWLFNIITRVLFSLPIKDTQCGFKLFKADVAINLFSKQKIDGFSFDVEILYLCKLYNYKVKEVGVGWHYAVASSKVKLLRDSIYMLKDLLKIRWSSLLGSYKK